MWSLLIGLALAAPPLALSPPEPPPRPERWTFPPPVDPSEPATRGMKLYAGGLAAGRVALGLAPIVAFESTSQLLGYPAEHDNPSARVMARLFGVRDIGLGVVVLASMEDRRSLSRAFLFNAAIDVADASMISIPLIRDEGIDTAAQRSLGFALGGMSMWLAGWAWLRWGPGA